MKNDTGRRWYLTVLAVYYLVMCFICSLYVLLLHFFTQGGNIPIPQQLLCMAYTVGTGLYFFRPRVGQFAMIILTQITLIAIGTTDPLFTMFHLSILMILVVPLIKTLLLDRSANNAKV